MQLLWKGSVGNLSSYEPFKNILRLANVNFCWPTSSQPESKSANLATSVSSKKAVLIFAEPLDVEYPINSYVVA